MELMLFGNCNSIDSTGAGVSVVVVVVGAVFLLSPLLSLLLLLMLVGCQDYQIRSWALERQATHTLCRTCSFLCALSTL